MTSDPNSRRNFLQTVVISAVAAATPMSFLEAATQKGTVTFELENGTELEVTRSGKGYTAVQKSKGKIMSRRPTGSFKLKSGEMFEVKNGQVINADVTPSMRARGGDNFHVKHSLSAARP